MVRELVVRVRHAARVLGRCVVRLRWVRHRVQGHWLIPRVLDFAEVHMRDLLVVLDRRVVRRRVAGQLREVL